MAADHELTGETYYSSTPKPGNHFSLPPGNHPSTVATSRFSLESVYDKIVAGGKQDWKAVFANIPETFDSLLRSVSLGSTQLQEPPSSVWDQIQAAIYSCADFFAARSSAENTSIVLAFITFAVLVMSWVPKWSNWSGRISPFARSPHSGPTKISDDDFSYITTDDLRRHQQEGGDVSEATADDLGPERETDVLVLRNKRKEYHIHFPAYSIARGDLSIGQVRDAAARKTNTDSKAIKLLYKGKNLKDDSRTGRSEGLRDGSEIMCTIADLPSASPSGSDDDEDGSAVNGSDTYADGEGTKRRRNRGKKSHRRNKREAAANDSSTNSPSRLGVPSSQNSRAPSPKPTTPLEKLDALQGVMNSYLPECESFMRNPPADPAKREFDHKRLAETILTKVVMALDGVTTDGDEDARARRKALVREAQQLLTDLDAVMK